MIHHSFKRFAKVFSTLRRLARWHYSRTRYANWKAVLQRDHIYWSRVLKETGLKDRVLIPTCVGSLIGTTHLESLLGVALSLRGVRVEFLLCDAALPACVGCEIGYLGNLHEKNFLPLSHAFCSRCFAPAFKALSPLNLRIHRFQELLSPGDIERCRQMSAAVPLSAIPEYAYRDIAVGEHAYAGALRFYARGDLNGAPFAEEVIRQYLMASLISATAMFTLFDREHFECAVFNHGIYVPQGIVGEVCRKRGVRVVNWNAAYRKKCFIFSHQETYHHTLMSEPIDKWGGISWTTQRENVLIGYLNSRREGVNDWIWFHKKPIHRVDGALARMGMDPSKPCIGMLTSVMWDAALHYPANAFPNMLEWVFHTIDYFRNRPDLQLIMRVHPAEIQGGLPSRQRVVDEIRNRYPDGIPGNIFVIAPESRLSTYALMEKCNAVIIYNTKTGIELSAMGVPVIVAGEAWIRNKGFSIDVTNPVEYSRVLDRLPLPDRMSSADTLQAKKYAYHFFFRRMIPLELMEPTGGNPPFRVNLKTIDELQPGKSRGLDLICDGILNGSDFISDG
jgi:hypothetical protein